jgi:hypothetical protein
MRHLYQNRNLLKGNSSKGELTKKGAYQKEKLPKVVVNSTHQYLSGSAALEGKTEILARSAGLTSRLVNLKKLHANNP